MKIANVEALYLRLLEIGARTDGSQDALTRGRGCDRRADDALYRTVTGHR